MKVKMPKELKEKWLTALRSGEYLQGRGSLMRHNSLGGQEFCCLGVLQMVADGDVERDTDGGPRALPTREWFDDHGFKDCPVVQVSINENYSLTHLNDEEKRSFSEIADIVERFVEGV